MRVIYSFLFYLIIPFLILRLIWRSFKLPAYRQRWYERLGFYTIPKKKCDIWFHAVSVGEIEALFPLILKIQQQNPHLSLLITTTTPTGFARVISVLKDTVTHVYLPYDVPFAIHRFITHFKPQKAVIVETEIWINLYLQCAKNNIPLYLINARLSEKSMRGYLKISKLIQPVLNAITLIATQSEQDKERFLKIGAKQYQIKTIGNIKFDVTVSDELINEGLLLKHSLFSNRFVWIIASTHEGEEILCLKIYQELKEIIPTLLLMIAPRHPERFNTVQKLCHDYHLKTIIRTDNAICDKTTDVFLINTIGELKLFYATADIAFVGGSMVSVGGHNILEPAIIGIPVLFGWSTHNFKTIAQTMLENKAAIQCNTAESISETVKILFFNNNKRNELIINAKYFIRQNQGTLIKLYDIVTI